MKKSIALLSVVCIFCILVFSVSAETLDGTKVRSGVADPWLFTDGEYYYLTQTGTSRIALFRSETLNGFASQKIADNIVYDSANDPTVTELFGADATLSGTWSPEIHYYSEEDFPGNSGWYMFLALRKNTGDSSVIQMVVLKSTSGEPKGPYGHPTTGAEHHSQPLLRMDGTVYSDWGCGQSSLRISEGAYRGIYTLWVTEVGRGEGLGNFYQKIMIAKMQNPWTLAGVPAVVTTPTQDWEKAGSSSTHPYVVEGATAVYGIHGEVYLTYSGSGYWSNYGLGQLTWTGGDPLETSSWCKLPTPKNPIFSAVTASDLRGAGHASFITDTDGNGFFCYHAYPYADGTKASSRSAYIEPYYIDYTEWNGTSFGVIHLGINDDRVPADTASAVNFAIDGNALGVPTVTAASGSGITLQMSAANADGYSIFRSTDGVTFHYLASTESTTYTDGNVIGGTTYYYRVWAYREEEISAQSQVVSATTSEGSTVFTSLKPSADTMAQTTATAATITWQVMDDVDGYKIWRLDPGKTAYSPVKAIYDPNATSYTDSDLDSGTVYSYRIRAFYQDAEGVFHFSDKSDDIAAYTIPTMPTATLAYDISGGIQVTVTSSTACTGYVYCRSDDSGASYSVIRITTDASIVDHDVAVGATYYYRVYAYAGDVLIRSDSTLAGSFTAHPEAAVISSISCTDGAVTFTWGAVDNIDGYKIWRKISGTTSWTTLGKTTELTFTDTTAESGMTYVYAVQTYKKVDGTYHYSYIAPVGVTIET